LTVWPGFAELELKQDPMNGGLFIFINRRRTAVKILVYDGQGFWLCQKRFSKGRIRFWPKDGASLTAPQVQVLLYDGHPQASDMAPAWRPLSGPRDFRACTSVDRTLMSGMAKPLPEDILELATDEIPELIGAVEGSPLSERHKAIILTLIQQTVDINRTNHEKMAALRKIKRMLGPKTEKKPRPEKPTTAASPRKGHGRYGVDDYPSATVVKHTHHLKPGEQCPLCAHGTLQAVAPRRFIRLKGQSPIVAELHEPACMRCSGCGEIITAELPPEVGDEKADASANAVVAVFRYGLGIPHYRLAAMQLAMGRAVAGVDPV